MWVAVWVARPPRAGGQAAEKGKARGRTTEGVSYPPRTNPIPNTLALVRRLSLPNKTTTHATHTHTTFGGYVPGRAVKATHTQRIARTSGTKPRDTAAAKAALPAPTPDLPLPLAAAAAAAGKSQRSKELDLQARAFPITIKVYKTITISQPLSTNW